MKSLLFTLMMLLLNVSAAVSEPGKPLPVREAFALEVERGADGFLRFEWKVEDGYYLYRDKFSAVQDGKELALNLPKGVAKDDPTFGATEVFFEHAAAELQQPAFGTFDLSFQGCQDDGICYAPQTVQVDPQTLKIVWPETELGVARQWTIGSGGSVPPETFQFEPNDDDFSLAGDQGLIDRLLARGGVSLVLLSFPLFGVLLAFTPCVFPMYPILAAALAREGDRLTARRGLQLSSLYVLGLASAFALLGAVAGWSGQNLQFVLQSPWTVGVLAALFTVMALGMFGAFQLQLPHSWTNWVTRRSGAPDGSRRSAAILGFSSAVIVGPCVTVPLAGALLYIAQSADIALGAAALFGLGLGKGLPLIILGTIGGRTLPRSGAWMTSVNHLFGFGFLATAIWTATPILPQGADLVLWALFLAGIASFLLSRKINSEMGLVAVRALSAIALAYGGILLAGASAGGVDPLSPLEPLTSQNRNKAAAEPSFEPVTSTSHLKAELTRAAARPSMVYFTADWCVTCTVIERTVLKDSAVTEQLSAFSLLKADITKFNKSDKILMQALKVAGPPTMIFFDANGKEVPDTRLIGSITTRNLRFSAQKADER